MAKKEINPAFVYLVYGIKLLIEASIIYFTSDAFSLLMSWLILNVVAAIVAAIICRRMGYLILAMFAYVIVGIVAFALAAALSNVEGNIGGRGAFGDGLITFALVGLAALPIMLIVQLAACGVGTLIEMAGNIEVVDEEDKTDE